MTTPPSTPLLPADGELSVMSFNLRYAKRRSDQPWPRRRPVTRALLNTERPHLVGTQEGLCHQIHDIAEDLPDHYDWIGVGRGGGERGEYAAIFYDTRRLTALDHGHFWLSRRPERVASRSWGTSVERMVTWVLFSDRALGHQLLSANTHFDHRSARARRHSARLLAERLRALAPHTPRVVTGDFNTTPEAEPVHRLLLDGASLTDTWERAECRGPDWSTYHGFRAPRQGGERIDWILSSPDLRCRAALANPFALHGQYPSDHLPVQALLTPTDRTGHPHESPLQEGEVS
ncbi:endonuclease/exonuclease/phosphatase family protein [Streptomyces sp. NPDC005438]|uniref:endonuclease/exonuclease/phosphatase family protein n=1 Tax=Streptomyces sp. NPDC005438 TaxID=3156880 RepID=UPI0033A01A8A